jgi:hypothetical protein
MPLVLGLLAVAEEVGEGRPRSISACPLAHLMTSYVHGSSALRCPFQAFLTLSALGFSPGSCMRFHSAKPQLKAYLFVPQARRK